jgi:2-haloacid dehalogenase
VLREWRWPSQHVFDDYHAFGLYKNYWNLGQGLFRMIGAIRGVAIDPRRCNQGCRCRCIEEGYDDDASSRERGGGAEDAQGRGLSYGDPDKFASSPRREEPAGERQPRQVFRAAVSIEAARAYKPAQVVYHMVVQELDVPPQECCLVATHVCDTIGAQSAGMPGGILTRSGNAILPIASLPQPNPVAPICPRIARRWRNALDCD